MDELSRPHKCDGFSDAHCPLLGIFIKDFASLHLWLYGFSRLHGCTHSPTGARRDDVVTAGERGPSGVRAPSTCEVTSGGARDGLPSFCLERLATTIKQQAGVHMGPVVKISFAGIYGWQIGNDDDFGLFERCHHPRWWGTPYRVYFPLQAFPNYLMHNTFIAHLGCYLEESNRPLWRALLSPTPTVL
ncbi:hypothetical protein TREMEDRAFT_58124 [Tremella mesenterica DSM 1558]|uniref:uncharacterized protein n=1 Tax=Tremella mesenterica (strain ATCC 24925 / CBS 8224 / DSM 1558 / NBRC 9311 / NRRL Y-6157 / RJB 2259-6 / UBC 559-6) TaxID=578456 RepID=UPI0003F495ED|nr:uncharacterized protein TREMEDRAFT_58124 [Tremella mesenterica DSM 1558]EIW71978.1 hypothetical protein TREMEDRAFT_58124 [Tremella mesenterica DSM 1558]